MIIKNWDSDDKFKERSVQCQKYLVARDYKPTNISSEQATRPKNNNNFQLYAT